MGLPNAFDSCLPAVESVVNIKSNANAQDLENSLIFCLSSGCCQAGVGFRIAVLMEVVSQQGKEIIKTVLRCLLRDAVTLKNRIEEIAEAGTFYAAFITRIESQPSGAVAANHLPCSQVGSTGCH